MQAVILRAISLVGYGYQRGRPGSLKGGCKQLTLFSILEARHPGEAANTSGPET